MPKSKPESINLRGRFTCHEVGQLLGISPARVRQIELRALEKLRKEFKKLGLTNPFK